MHFIKDDDDQSERSTLVKIGQIVQRKFVEWPLIAFENNRFFPYRKLLKCIGPKLSRYFYGQTSFLLSAIIREGIKRSHERHFMIIGSGVVVVIVVVIVVIIIIVVVIVVVVIIAVIVVVVMVVVIVVIIIIIVVVGGGGGGGRPP